jgi:molybdate transport system ATP-binding protein
MVLASPEPAAVAEASIEVAIALEVHDGRRRFELDVAFASNEPVIGLYGPSGGGKSLTLQAIAGLLRPRAGRVRIGSEQLFDAQAGIDVPTEARGVGYLFQHYALFPHLSVRDNVAFGLTSWRRRLAAGDAARVDDLLQTFGLADLAASRPQALSGGQQQRVALARALACQPRVLLLDEPFAALNPMLRQRLRDELAAVRARWNIPVVMISHDIEDLLALAGTVFVIDGGRVVQQVPIKALPSRDAARAALHLPALV